MKCKDKIMTGTVLYGPLDIRFEDVEMPTIAEPTDAVLRLAATCVCGSDLWPFAESSASRVRREWVMSTAESLKRWAAPPETSNLTAMKSWRPEHRVADPRESSKSGRKRNASTSLYASA
jgi:hypothetical protein